MSSAAPTGAFSFNSDISGIAGVRPRISAYGKGVR
jgi:hypothetical protein